MGRNEQLIGDLTNITSNWETWSRSVRNDLDAKQNAAFDDFELRQRYDDGWMVADAICEGLTGDCDTSKYERFPDPNGKYLCIFLSKSLVKDIERRALRKAKAAIDKVMGE